MDNLQVIPPVEFKVGDIITSYHKGFHKVTRVTPRNYPGRPMTALLDYVRVCGPDGQKAARNTNSCDSFYCKKVTRSTVQDLYAKLIERAHVLQDSLNRAITND